MNGFNRLLKRSKKIDDIAVHWFIIFTLLSNSFLEILNIYHKSIIVQYIFRVILIFVPLHWMMVSFFQFYWWAFWSYDFWNILWSWLPILTGKKGLKNFILCLLIRKGYSIFIFYFPLFLFPNTWLFY